MPRTQAQIEAADRDGLYCLWSKYRAKDPALIFASHVHHIARRQPGSDLPQLCVHLSLSAHLAHHNGDEPTTPQLLNLMLAVYGLDLRADFPRFFAQY